MFDGCRPPGRAEAASPGPLACQQCSARHNLPQDTLETACEDCGEKIEKPQEAS